MEREKLNSVERDLVEGLEGFLADLKKDEPIAEKYNCRRIILDLHPQSYKGEDVKAIRDLLHISQVLFAQFLGVSVKTVRSWERGKAPSDMACRFMDEIRQDPDYWRKRLKQSARVKTFQDA